VQRVCVRERKKRELEERGKTKVLLISLPKCKDKEVESLSNCSDNCGREKTRENN